MFTLVKSCRPAAVCTGKALKKLIQQASRGSVAVQSRYCDNDVKMTEELFRQKSIYLPKAHSYANQRKKERRNSKLLKCPATTSSATDVLKGLRKLFAEDEVNENDIKALLRSYKSNPDDWQKHTKFEESRYTRTLLDGGNGKYNVIMLCWNKGQATPVHAHSDSHCFVKVLDGQITETIYAWPDKENHAEPMQVLKQSTVDVDDLLYINDSIGLHRMHNTSATETTVTLHVYAPPYKDCAIFDEESGERDTCQIVLHHNLEGAL